MISILTQERLLGAALGTVMASVVVFEQRKSIYKSISENQSRFSPQSQIIHHTAEGRVFQVFIFVVPKPFEYQHWSSSLVVLGIVQFLSKLTPQVYDLCLSNHTTNHT
ncbi:hypothetical protein MTR67_049469 [Solanum verrucosum]|uniref:Uncharacterized protein n=1 Tax=Solanum verrucosum TaxID=315347 RepID=A0AAF0V2P2_SOLVR|nr:hypothetical protein MTR67_049469 [Solanum verrucosum]